MSTKFLKTMSQSLRWLTTGAIFAASLVLSPVAKAEDKPPSADADVVTDVKPGEDTTDGKDKPKPVKPKPVKPKPVTKYGIIDPVDEPAVQPLYGIVPPPEKTN